LSTEQLIVELIARTDNLEAGLNASNEELRRLRGNVDEADSGLRRFSGTAKAVGGAVVKAGAGVIAMGTAITAMVLSAASGRKELEQFARMAKTTESDFKALSFATSQFGIEADQIADITKDISDKIGEFVTAGTGAFQDVGDVLKLTTDETRALALEFQNLTGEEVISRLAKDLEEAGASGDQTTAVFEALGSDLSKLKPLFADNSKELIKLKARFDEVNDAIKITDLQAEKLKDVSKTFNLLTSSLGNAATAVSATLAPVLDDFFNDIIEVVPEATQTLIDFINKFKSLENINSTEAASKILDDAKSEVEQLKKDLESSKARRLATGGKFDSSRVNQRAIQEDIDQAEIQVQKAKERLEVLKEIEAISDAETREGGKIGGATGDPLDPASPLVMADDEAERLEALRKFTQTRAELLDAQLLDDVKRLEEAKETLGLKDEELFARRIELVEEFNDRKASLEDDQGGDSELDALREFTQTRSEILDAQLLDDIERLELAAETFGLKDEELYARRIELVKEFNDRKASLEDDNLDKKDEDTKTEMGWAESSMKSQLDQGTKLLTSLGNNSKTAHKIKQGLAIGNTIMTTAENINEQFPNPVGMTLAGLTGAAQLAAITSSTSNGGGSLPSATSAPPPPRDEPTKNFNDQGATITDISDQQQTSQRLVIEFNDEVVDAISRQIQKSQSDGRT